MTSAVVLTEIKQRFEDPQDVQWSHTFNGYWQNLHPIEILLAFDGTAYHGSMRLETGDQQFDLQGYQQDGRAMIQEIDETGRTSGYLVVDIVEGRMTGQWWSVDFSRSASLSLRSEEVVELRRFEPTLMAISGTLDQNTINLMIQREESDLLSGFCALGSDETYYKLTGHCEDATCDRMSITLMSPASETQQVQCFVQRSNAIRLQLYQEGGAILEGIASLKGKYPMQRLHHATYVGHVDCLYPNLSVPAFDTWLQGQMEGWYADTRKHLDSLHTVYGTPGPQERWSMQASAWVDFTLINEDIISGLITSFNPEQGRYQRMAFVFEVRSGKLMPLRDIGRKAHFEEDLCADATELKQITGDDPALVAWLEGLRFKYITLSPEGFVLFTDFDPGFGEQWIFLPFTDYAHELKRNAFVFDLSQK